MSEFIKLLDNFEVQDLNIQNDKFNDWNISRPWAKNIFNINKEYVQEVQTSIYSFYLPESVLCQC